MSIHGNSVLRRVWLVSHELPDEEVAFFDEPRSELVVVNGVGGAIWQLLDGVLDVTEICQMLSEEVQGAPGPDLLEAQVIAFLQMLLERKAVEVVSPPS